MEIYTFPHDRKKEQLQSLKSATSGEILAASGIYEARVGASELPKGPAEDIQSHSKTVICTSQILRLKRIQTAYLAGYPRGLTLNCNIFELF